MKQFVKGLGIAAVFAGFTFGMSAFAESEIESTTLYSKELGIDWNYDVYLPDGYEEMSSEEYPVIYLMHGLYGNHTNLLERFDSKKMLDDAITETGQPAIAVFVDGFNSFYVNAKDGMQMEKAIMKDLVPYIEKQYNVDKNADQHAIGGISMGGYGAARLALRYPNRFKHAMLISPAVWQRLDSSNQYYKTLHAFNDGEKNWSWDKYDSLAPTKYLKKKGAKDVDFFIETSKADKVVPVKDVAEFKQKLANNGNQVTYKEDETGDHTWTYWETVAPQGYKWILEKFKGAEAE